MKERATPEEALIEPGGEFDNDNYLTYFSVRKYDVMCGQYEDRRVVEVDCYSDAATVVEMLNWIFDGVTPTRFTPHVDRGWDHANDGFPNNLSKRYAWLYGATGRIRAVTG